MSVPENGRYGEWAGNPRGVPERPDRCVEEVWPRGQWIARQCVNRRGHGPDGKFCKVHAKKADTRGAA